MGELTFAEEKWGPFSQDAMPLFKMHWAEIGVNQDSIVLDVDDAGYRRTEQAGCLFILTARKSGRLIGYITALIHSHLHYKSSGPMALTDIYFVVPQERRGVGIGLFVEFEKRMRQRGIKQIITSCKCHSDNTPFLERLGFVWTDKTFCKVLN